MHRRADDATVKTLAKLHKECGPQIWNFAVILLTRANEYPSTNWLDSKRLWETSGTVLRRGFEKSLTEKREYIQHVFTAKSLISECQIGLTEEEFETLKLPIIPVARLHPKDTKRMELVGYGSWFNYFLVECSTRENGVGFLKIHKDRLSHLPSNIEASMKQCIGPQQLEHARKLAKDHPSIGRLYLIICRKVYWRRHRKQIICAPRFESAKPAEDS